MGPVAMADCRRLEKELKGHVSFLWTLFVSSYNASPGSLADSVRLSEAVTRGARELNLSVAMAPKYQWSDNVLTATIKYGVQKALPQERYQKPTKAQLARGRASRALEAASGSLPDPGPRRGPEQPGRRR